MDGEPSAERGHGRPSRRAILVAGLGATLVGGAAAAYELVQGGVLRASSVRP